MKTLTLCWLITLPTARARSLPAAPHARFKGFKRPTWLKRLQRTDLLLPGRTLTHEWRDRRGACEIRFKPARAHPPQLCVVLTGFGSPAVSAGAIEALGRAFARCDADDGAAAARTGRGDAAAATLIVRRRWVGHGTGRGDAAAATSLRTRD